VRTNNRADFCHKTRNGPFFGKIAATAVFQLTEKRDFCLYDNFAQKRVKTRFLRASEGCFRLYFVDNLR
jgi:hypothetical protein